MFYGSILNVDIACEQNFPDKNLFITQVIFLLSFSINNAELANQITAMCYTRQKVRW